MKKQRHDIKVQNHILRDGSMTSELQEFLKGVLAERKANAVDHKQPPWQAFPEYDRYSMGWRMGPGEDYRKAFRDWIRGLDEQEVDAFISAFPEPEDWAGFYDTIGIDR